MADFKQGIEVVTPTPKVVVDSPLTPGTYVYQLVVEDDLKNLSKPAQAEVQINKG